MSPSESFAITRVLVIGPLPPPHGGSRVSFDRFLRYVRRLPNLEVRHVDLPVRRQDRDGQPGGVSPISTLIRGLLALVRVPMSDRVVFFSSRGLAFSFGLVLIAVSRLFRRPIALRLFGGRPYLAAASRVGLSRRTTEWLLSLASSITLETTVGRNDFPESLRDRVKTVTGYRPRSAAGSPRRVSDGPFRFVYAGRVDRTKGADVLLDACRKLAAGHPERALLVDCYGRASEEVLRPLEEDSNVRLMGVVDNEEYLSRLASYDAFVYPSVYDNEGHPGAVIEAMLCGLPIICSSLPAVLEIVTDGFEAITFDPGDAGALADAMYRIATDPVLRERLASGSRDKGAEFDENVVIPKLLREMGLNGGRK